MTAMSKVACILLAAWCAIAELPSKKQREEILECHTKQREEVEPAASDMQLMVYSKELEQLAEEFAATCKLPVTYPQRHPKYGRIGYVVVVEHTHKPNYTDVFCKYSGGYYDYDKGKCKGICYQYKQIVRAKTAAVGCTIHHCNYQLEDPKQGYVLACLYSPSKQVIREKPYSKGPSCSQCPRGSKCFRKQCYHD
uniref:SCP domain-containing protein n=1 Tax=Mesocestoides corti TaxID=53468 RepID=A0A5K3F5T4_MESCO